MAPNDAAFGPRDIYRSFRAERNVALHRVLRRLPDEFIVALIEGLEQADVITPGRLFAGRRGGCAVGVTLRVLFPRYRGRRFIRGRRLQKSVMRLRRGSRYEVSHLFALEQVFDRSVLLLQERFSDVPPADVAKATALWIAGEARTELVLRELDSEWLADAVRRARAGRRPQRGSSIRSSTLRSSATPSPQAVPARAPAVLGVVVGDRPADRGELLDVERAGVGPRRRRCAASRRGRRSCRRSTACRPRCRRARAAGSAAASRPRLRPGSLQKPPSPLGLGYASTEFTWEWPATHAITFGYSCRSASMSAPRWSGLESRGSRSQPGLRSWPWPSGTGARRRELVGDVRRQARDRVVAEEDDELVRRRRLLELALAATGTAGGRRCHPPRGRSRPPRRRCRGR